VVDHHEVRREHGYHPLRVEQVVQETADTRSYVLDVADDLRDLFRYRAGQFCTFRVHVDGDELLRSYSMSSAPETDARLTVTVKRVPDGRVSGWFHDHVSEGDVLEVTKPAGVFCVRDEGRPIVAFAGGSGVTPVISITKSVLAVTERPVRLLYANRDRDSIIFRAELEDWQRRHPGRLEVAHRLDAEEGFADEAAVRRFVGASLAADFYVCGPGPFMDVVERGLLGLGVAPPRPPARVARAPFSPSTGPSARSRCARARRSCRPRAAPASSRRPPARRVTAAAAWRGCGRARAS
jgi:ferredoxin-NADP reductase